MQHGLQGIFSGDELSAFTSECSQQAVSTGTQLLFISKVRGFSTILKVFVQFKQVQCFQRKLEEKLCVPPASHSVVGSLAGAHGPAGLEPDKGVTQLPTPLKLCAPSRTPVCIFFPAAVLSLFLNMYVYNVVKYT